MNGSTHLRSIREKHSFIEFHQGTLDSKNSKQKSKARFTPLGLRFFPRI